jgi:hypothetical protein
VQSLGAWSIRQYCWISHGLSRDPAARAKPHMRSSSSSGGSGGGGGSLWGSGGGLWGSVLLRGTT